MLSTCKDAKEARFTAVKEAGFTCKDAKEAGFKAGKECYEAGFTYDEGKAAGFPSRIKYYGTFYDNVEAWWVGGSKSPSKNSNPG